ncbi:MAG: adenylate/guanylate cyclase domain-containing protein [Chloroflexota bacterium]
MRLHAEAPRTPSTAGLDVSGHRPAALPPLEGERKHVTVLFADIRGSTELIQGLDPEDAQVLLDGAVQAMMDAVHEFEGTVNHILGDGIMALFGAPIAHEDYAVRASYAALALQRRLAAYSEQLQRDHGLSMQARVGLSSGEVVLRAITNDLQVDYSAMGETVHLASRLESLARPGAVLMTDETLALVQGFLETRPLGPVAIKGIARPVEVFELVGAGPIRTRLQAMGARGLSPLVGRDAELAELERALDSVVRGSGRIVGLVGEPGVGKSRLILETLRLGSARGCRAVASGSVSYGRAAAFHPIIDLLSGYVGVDPQDDEDTRRAKLVSRVLGLDPSLASIVSPLAALLDVAPADRAWQALDPMQRRQATFDALRRLVVREAQDRPIIMVFEDLHWVDPDTEALLTMLADEIQSIPVLLLVDYRPEYSCKLADHPAFREVRVEPLSDDVSVELVERLLGPDPSVRDLATVLVSRASGNPFFVEELVQSLVESGDLVGDRGWYRLTRPVHSVRAPRTVRAVLSARIDRLDPAAKRVLQAAAVIGSSVPDWLLRRVADEPDVDLEAQVDALERADLLLVESLYPVREYTFKHALTHEVAYSGLLVDRRHALHLRALAALESTEGEPVTELLGQLAHHAYQGADWGRAARYQYLAGQRSAARSANREAVIYYETALEALEHLPADNERLAFGVDVRLALRSALLPLADIERLVVHVRDAAEIAAELGDDRRHARALAYLTNACWWQRHFSEAVGCGERAFELARAAGDRSTQVAAYLYLGHNHVALGNFQVAAEYQRANLQILEDDEEPYRHGMAAYPAALSRSLLAFCLAEQGEFDEAAVCGSQAMATARALNHPYTMAIVASVVGMVHHRRGHVEEAIAHFSLAHSLAEMWSFPLFGPGSGAQLAAAYAMGGRDEDARRILADLDEDSPLGADPLAQVTATLALAYMLVGDLVAARHHATVALEQSLVRGERGSQAWCEWLLGPIFRLSLPRDVEQSRRHYEQALALARTLGMRPLEALAILGMGRLHLEERDPEEARRLFCAARDMMTDMDMSFWLAEIDGHLAAIDSASAIGSGVSQATVAVPAAARTIPTD